MSLTIGAFEAKTHLSELLARVEAGEQVTISKHGRPVARLVPINESGLNRDWQAYWQRVDAALVSLPHGSTVKKAIEIGRV